MDQPGRPRLTSEWHKSGLCVVAAHQAHQDPPLCNSFVRHHLLSASPDMATRIPAASFRRVLTDLFCHRTANEPIDQDTSTLTEGACRILRGHQQGVRRTGGARRGRGGHGSRGSDRGDRANGRGDRESVHGGHGARGGRDRADRAGHGREPQSPAGPEGARRTGPPSCGRGSAGPRCRAKWGRCRSSPSLLV